jgi:hypothetical protein
LASTSGLEIEIVDYGDAADGFVSCAFDADFLGGGHFDGCDGYNR